MFIPFRIKLLVLNKINLIIKSRDYTLLNINIYIFILRINY